MFKWCSALSTCSLYQCSATHEQTVHVNKMLTNLSTHCTCSYKNSWHGSKVQCSGTTFQQLACDSWQLLSLFLSHNIKQTWKRCHFYVVSFHCCLLARFLFYSYTRKSFTTFRPMVRQGLVQLIKRANMMCK